MPNFSSFSLSGLPPSILTAAILSVAPLSAQLLYVGPANFGGLTGKALFEFSNGGSTILNTGFVEHNFPSLSRDNRFITFSSPDPVIPGLQVPPSSDIYLFDRATGTTNRMVNYVTDTSNPNSIVSFTPVSSELSPNNQLLAFGVAIAVRQGSANAQGSRELYIIDTSTNNLVSNPTAQRGFVSDPFQAEFVGLSWDPGGDSFVTTNYVTWNSQRGIPINLPTIVRFARTPGTNNWIRSAILSSAGSFDAALPVQAITQIYPAISPSGAGLAYFSLNWDDSISVTTGVRADLIIANADGTNARILHQFPQNKYPAGLTWSPDGTSLIVSIADQVVTSAGFQAAADITTAEIRAVSTSNGAISPITGISEPAFFPMWRASASSGTPAGSLNGVDLLISKDSAGQISLSSTTARSDRVYFLHSSTTLDADSFGTPQAFLGTQLLNGIPVNSPEPILFFRLTEVD